MLHTSRIAATIECAFKLKHQATRGLFRINQKPTFSAPPKQRYVNKKVEIRAYGRSKVKPALLYRPSPPMSSVIARIKAGGDAHTVAASDRDERSIIIEKSIDDPFNLRK